MASFHCEIKSGGKGKAAEHAAYIARQGWHRNREDLLFKGHGNLPQWAGNEPGALWKAADRYERANGATYRELIIALPRELGVDQLQSLVDRMVAELIQNKPYQYAVHQPSASLEGNGNPHLHLMYSERLPDEVQRPAERWFSRYNAKNPALGGCRKDNAGRAHGQVRNDLRATRQTVADLQNQQLAAAGCASRVDHRTLQDQGEERQPERHLGRARINRMSVEEKAAFVGSRESPKRSTNGRLESLLDGSQ